MILFLLGCAAGALFAWLAFFIFRRLYASHIERLLTTPPAPLLTWRNLSGRQLELLIRELEPNLPLTPSRRDCEAMARRVRQSHKSCALAFEQTLDLSAVATFLDEHGLSAQVAPGEGIRRLLERANIEQHTLRPAPSASYHPFDPPTGPVRMPAEFEPLRAVLLAWPTQFPVRWRAHAQLATEIAKRAEAHIVVHNAAWARAAFLFLERAGARLDRVRFICSSNDDLWMRDYGPTLVQTADGPAYIANPYIPNGLGFHKRDHDLPVEIGRQHGLPVYRLPIMIEGGNFLSDGAGRIFLTDSVFELNPDITRADLDEILGRWLGARELTILPSLPGEITGHVDGALKVTRDGAWVTTAPPKHPWRETLDETAAILAKTLAASGAAYRVERIPLAPPLRRRPTELCYCNSLIVNDAILYPSYDPSSDALAEQALRALAPDAEITGIDFRDFEIGALHCQTKEVPAL